MKKFFFYPKDKNEFFARVEGNYSRTLVFQPSTNEIVNVFSRNVGRVWKNSCKNEVETDHRIRKNSNLNEEHKYRAYSWISDSKSDSALSILLHIFQKMNKKILLVAIGLLFVFTAFAKDCPPNSTSQSIKELELSCRFITNYKNGELEEIGNYKNGELEGEWKVYHNNGKLKKIRSYKNGGGEGEWKWYHNNGKLEASGNYKNGKREGKWKWYRENGKLSSIENYKNGKREGEWKWYRENGKLSSIENYKNGEQVSVENF